MQFVDDYGVWNVLGEIQLSDSPVYLFVPNTSKKIIRYTYLIDWNVWDNNPGVRSNALVRWHYGNNNELVGFYSKLYPKKESNIVAYNLISENLELVPRKLEARIIKQGKRLYLPGTTMLPWSLKVEEFQSV
ncbi:MAG: hypothetical protein HC836_40340 [Richelia sp. RM2_1_2]|nr:hypothetical protein [Richelia sp. SM1_7_0]NJN09240.1 hypothetical protein [Richelia sp. RM1_1_1]NJO27378.1 hypothetical protein [Richelia sp. SL_2_1]NJO64203.1 hypothetical protein [Richelia sp. RM2_1_2]